MFRTAATSECWGEANDNLSLDAQITMRLGNLLCEQCPTPHLKFPEEVSYTGLRPKFWSQMDIFMSKLHLLILWTSKLPGFSSIH